MKNKVMRIRSDFNALLKYKKELMIILACAYICIAAVCYFVLKANASEIMPESRKYVTMHIVQRGETLFGLARQYGDPAHYPEAEDYIREVRFTNHLTDERIPAGRLLYLPYYAQTPKTR